MWNDERVTAGLGREVAFPKNPVSHSWQHIRNVLLEERGHEMGAPAWLAPWECSVTFWRREMAQGKASLIVEPWKMLKIEL